MTALAAVPAGSPPPDVESLAAETLPWLGVFAAAAVVLWILATILKRRLAGGVDRSPAGFSVEEIDRLRAKGELSEEQARAIRRAMIADSTRSAGPVTPRHGPGTPPPRS